MEGITKTGVPGDDNGETREGHEIDNKNVETGMQNEVKETEANEAKAVDQENDCGEKKTEETDAECVNLEIDTGEKESEETDLSDDGEMSPLLTLSWDDIMFRNVLPFLRWDDLFRLRCTCYEAKCMVDTYFQQQRKMDFSYVQCRFNGEAFKVVTANCTQLRTLIIQRAKWMVDKDIIPVFKQNKNLDYVDLSDCGNLNGTCLLALSVNCKKLKTLILSCCNWLNQGAMETLIAHTDCLENVDLTGCSGLSNDTLLAFVQKFKLKQFILMNNYQTVNDETVLNIARERGDTIEYLDVSGCFCVTDFGVNMVTEYCHKIKALYTTGNNLVSENSLCKLRERGVRLDQHPFTGQPTGHVPFPYLQV